MDNHPTVQSIARHLEAQAPQDAATAKEVAVGETTLRIRSGLAVPINVQVWPSPGVIEVVLLPVPDVPQPDVEVDR